jgi:glutamine synthetase adenylyltransferase
LNKEKLIELGLTEEQAAQIAKTLEGAYIPKPRFNEVNTELKGLRDQLKERDAQLSELQKVAGDAQALNKLIDDLKETNELQKEAHETALKQLKIDSAVDVALLKASAKNNKAVKALLELDKVNITQDGNIEGLDEQIKTLTQAEDSRFLFGTTSAAGFQGVKPGESRDGVPAGVDFSKASYSELCTFLDQNPEAQLN